MVFLQSSVLECNTLKLEWRLHKLENAISEEITPDSWYFTVKTLDA